MTVGDLIRALKAYEPERTVVLEEHSAPNWRYNITSVAASFSDPTVVIS